VSPFAALKSSANACLPIATTAPELPPAVPQAREAAQPGVSS
jgi:hypothetical protein